MKIFAGSDHAGFKLKQALVAHLQAAGHEVVDLGTRDESSVDYPDFAGAVARAVRQEPAARGLLVCGTGIGVSIAANKVRGVRAVDAWNLETARLSRAHNDANVLCLGARVLAETDAQAIAELWLATPFEAGRHAERVDKITALERQETETTTGAPGPATKERA